jgi:hypothetical protein
MAIGYRLGTKANQDNEKPATAHDYCAASVFATLS